MRFILVLGILMVPEIASANEDPLAYVQANVFCKGKVEEISTDNRMGQGDRCKPMLVTLNVEGGDQLVDCTDR